MKKEFIYLLEIEIKKKTIINEDIISNKPISIKEIKKRIAYKHKIKYNEIVILHFESKINEYEEIKETEEIKDTEKIEKLKKHDNYIDEESEKSEEEVEEIEIPNNKKKSCINKLEEEEKKIFEKKRKERIEKLPELCKKIKLN